MIQNMAGGVFRGDDGGERDNDFTKFRYFIFSYVGSMYLHNNPKKFDDDERFFLEIQIGNLPLLRSDGILHF